MMKRKHKVLFVCLGNICRSPTAHGVFEAYVQKNGFEDQIEIDSAGTSGQHSGELPDERSRKHASKRGYDLNSHSRKMTTSDLEHFDEIFVMDDSNLKNVMNLDIESIYRHKIQKLTDLIDDPKIDSIPDPYFGGNAGFENVLDIIENAAEAYFKKWNLKK